MVVPIRFTMKLENNSRSRGISRRRMSRSRAIRIESLWFHTSCGKVSSQSRNFPFPMRCSMSSIMSTVDGVPSSVVGTDKPRWNRSTPLNGPRCRGMCLRGARKESEADSTSGEDEISEASAGHCPCFELRVPHRLSIRTYANHDRLGRKYRLALPSVHEIAVPFECPWLQKRLHRVAIPTCRRSVGHQGSMIWCQTPQAQRASGRRGCGLVPSIDRIRYSRFHSVEDQASKAA